MSAAVFGTCTAAKHLRDAGFGAHLFDDAGELALLPGKPDDVLLEGFSVGTGFVADVVGAADDEAGQRHRHRRHVAVAVSLPGPLHHRIREEVESRGETFEQQQLVAAAQKSVGRRA